jgi:glutamate racemase
VECVENGELDTPVTRGKVASFVNPLLEKGVDVIVLGCTHYPFLRDTIEAVAGKSVKVIDTGAAVAKHLKGRLVEDGLLNGHGIPGKIEFYTTGDASAATAAGGNLWTGATEFRFCPA